MDPFPPRQPGCFRFSEHPPTHARASKGLGTRRTAQRCAVCCVMVVPGSTLARCDTP